MPVSDMLHILRELMQDYEERESGLRIREMDKSFQLCTAAENDDYIQLLCTPAKQKRLSQPALETLAIIAYKQPVTRLQIEHIRGVSCAHSIDKLLEYDLVQELGRLNAPGRPLLFGTTDEFLRSFGVKSLSDLPELNEERMEDFREEAEIEARKEMEEREIMEGSAGDSPDNPIRVGI